MFKKIFLLFLASGILYLVSNTKVSAACYPPGPRGCGTNLLVCNLGTYSVCCDTTTDCNLATTTPTPPLVPPWFCDVSGNTARGINTGLGCVSFCAGPLASKALAWGGITNFAIALIILSIAIIMFITSGGDTKKIQAAKELFFSALGGIFLIIISVLLLNFLGVNLLNLDNLGFKVSPSCKPITFTAKPSPTRVPTPKPSITPIPTDTPQPTPIPPPPPPPPPPTPIPCYSCCTHKSPDTLCKSHGACQADTVCAFCCGKKTPTHPGGTGDRCAGFTCDQFASWCYGQPAPACV